MLHLLLALAPSPAYSSSSVYTGIRNDEAWPQADFRHAEAGSFTADDMIDVVVLDGTQLTLVPGPSAFFGRSDFGEPTKAFALLEPEIGFSSDRILAASDSGLEVYRWTGTEMERTKVIGGEAFAGATDIATWPGDSPRVVGLDTDGETLRTGSLSGTTLVSIDSFTVSGLRAWTLLDWDEPGDPEIATLDGSGLSVRKLNGAMVSGPHDVPSTRPRLERVPSNLGFDRLLWIVDDPLTPSNDYALLLDQRFPALEPGYSLGMQIGRLNVADIGGDGSPDLWFVDQLNSNAWVIHKNPDAVFPAPSYYLPTMLTVQVPLDHGAGYEPPLVVSADFDRDGDDDAVFASDAYEHLEFLRSDGIDEETLIPEVVRGVIEAEATTPALQVDLLLGPAPKLSPISPVDTPATATHIELWVYERTGPTALIDSTPIATAEVPYQVGAHSITAQWLPPSNTTTSWPLTLRFVRIESGTRTHVGPHVIYEYTTDASQTLQLASQPNPWGAGTLPVVIEATGPFQFGSGAGLHRRPNIAPVQL